MQTFQYELLTNPSSKVDEIMGFCLNQMSLIVVHNNIGRIVGMGTIFHDLDFNILQMPQHLRAPLFHLR